MHEDNCFVTLTYNENNLPAGGSLQLRHFQLFMKKLRGKYGAKIRFFHCGEYGPLLARPHYHALLFGMDFNDKLLIHQSPDKKPQYQSNQLEKLWGKGFCTIGAVNYQSAGYCARYIMKKITGRQAESHYQGKKPEYVTMSRRPGIGSTWFAKYQNDIYPDDHVIIDGKPKRVPSYYDYLIENSADPTNHLLHDATKRSRVTRAIPHKWNNTKRRLSIRESVTKAKISTHQRNYENEGTK